MKGGPLDCTWTVGRLVVVAVLVVASLVVTVLLGVLELNVWRQDALERWFDVNLEFGVPAWYSTILLFLAAQALWRLSEQSAGGRASRWARSERFLAAVFVMLSLDEMTQIHETANGLLRPLSDVSPVLAFPWVVVGLPAVLLVGLVMLGWLRALPARTRGWVLLSGAVFVVGAVGLELVGAALSTAYGRESVVYVLAYSVEETMEMVGVIIFLWAVDDLRRSRQERVQPVGLGAPAGSAIGGQPGLTLQP